MYHRKTRIYSMTLIVIMSTLVSCFRLALIAIPSVNPVTALVLMMGIVFGKKKGLMIGVLSTLLSSIITGFGPWVVFQLVGWGLIGLIGGVLGGLKWTNPYLLSVIGFGISFLFGWFTNLEIWFLYNTIKTIEAYISLGVASFYFDLAHAVSTSSLLLLTSYPLIRVLKHQYERYMPTNE